MQRWGLKTNGWRSSKILSWKNKSAPNAKVIRIAGDTLLLQLGLGRLGLQLYIRKAL